MRKIIFRGFSKKKHKWVYGDMEPSSDGKIIIWPLMILGDNLADGVPPESVGQFTGLKDREGKEIYEGDIVDFEPLRGKKSRGYVTYSDEKARYVVTFQRGKYKRPLSWVCSLGNPVVIGNTYENPELAKGSE